jgi:8-oxo-dGTP pyrophosphatase MutT (NUDIX family)
LAELDRSREPSAGGARAVVERWPAEDLPSGRAGAAVTMVLRDGHREVEVLLIERTVRKNDLASGHVALPGGRAEPEDATLGATAVRELSEEVGLGQHDVETPLRLLGVERADLFGLDVAVFAARLGARPAQLVPSPDEVAHIFWLPLPRLEQVESVERATTMGPRKVAAVVDNGRVLWGFTLRILRTYLGSAPRRDS